MLVLLLFPEKSMPEKKSEESKGPPAVPVPGNPPAAIPASPDQARQQPQADTAKASGPVVGMKKMPPAGMHEDGDTRPGGVQIKQAPKPVWNQKIWFILAVVLILLAVLVFIVSRGQKKGGERGQPAVVQEVQDGQELSNLSDFVAKNKALKEKPYSEKKLTDEPYFGRVPMSVRENGPLLSAETDPQLAALASALKIHVQIIHRSQVVTRGRSVSRITKGDYRGFRVNAVEKLENGMVVSEEVTVTTPQGASLKTVDQILQEVKKTDYSRIMAEIQNAGLEFSASPELAEEKILLGRLRSVGHWGRPVAGELLISGKSVGSITLGMPVVLIKKNLPASYNVLRRKVLVNDIYYDVYKVTDHGQEPLFYLYEKDGRVWGISVISEAFKTDKGIGIGSSLDLIRLHYPVITLAHSGKRPPFVRMNGVDGIFIIQAEGEKKVISILIGESPEFE
jgi:hypothetical protein